MTANSRFLQFSSSLSDFADGHCEDLKVPKMSFTYLSPLKDPKTLVSICCAYLLLNPSTVSILTPVHAARVVIPLAL